MSSFCEKCGRDLPPSRRKRRFCSDACRKRASREGRAAPTAVEGPVTAAVAAMLADITFDSIDTARAAMALALARLADGGSVPAFVQLRAVFDDLDLHEDAETLAFLQSVRTPGQRGAPLRPDGAG